MKNEMNAFKKVSHCPWVLAAPTLLPRGWSPPPPPTCCSSSAPPWITLVMVLTILAWFFEFNSSPSWLENIGSLLHQPCERFFVSLQNLDLKVIREVLFISFSAMWVYQVLVKCWFRSRLLTFAVEFANVLFWPAVHVLCRFSIVARTVKESCYIGWSFSSRAR